MAANGTRGAGKNNRVDEGLKCPRSIVENVEEREVTHSRRAMISMFEGIVVQTVIYGCETWALDENVRNMRNMLEM